MHIHNLQVYKANALLEASYRMTLAEQRLVLLCISQVRRDEELDESIVFTVTAAQYAETMGIAVSTAYDDLRAAAEQLFERRVVVYQDPNSPRASLRKTGKLVSRWVQTVRYLEHQGTVELRFSYDLTPYISQLSKHFTRYALKDVAHMRSQYAIRLYELLCQYKEFGERYMDLDWLRNLLSLRGEYRDFRDFRRCVLEPAIQQINEHTPMMCMYTTRRTNRRITGLHFSFIFDDHAQPHTLAPLSPRLRKPRPEKVVGDTINGVPVAIINSRAYPGETYAQAADRIREEDRRAGIEHY